MDRPARIHFHEDAAPYYDSLPKRYQENAAYNSDGVVTSLLIQHGFPIDFTKGSIIRTRVEGSRDPVDFPLASVLFIEWFYGEDLPSPLYYVEPKPKRLPNSAQSLERGN